MDAYNSQHRARTVRVAACNLRTTLGDPAANAHAVLDIARECHDERAAVAVFPELALTGYSLDDILMRDALLDAVEDQLQRITQASVELMPVLVIGAPLRHLHRIYNTAVVIHRGRVLGLAENSRRKSISSWGSVAPKSYLPICGVVSFPRPVSGPPAFSWSGSKLLLGARKRLASRAPAGVNSTNRSAKFLQRNVITTAPTLRFGPERHCRRGARLS
jgi:hypothetical protein